MKSIFFLTVVLGMSVTASQAYGQQNPLVFVQGKGSKDATSSAPESGRHWGMWGSQSTGDSHDEALEVAKELQKSCDGVVVTPTGANADYTITMIRESKNRALLRTNSQMEVVNRAGDVIATSLTHNLGNAAKGACQMISSDWQVHGRIAASQTAPAAAVPAAPTAVKQQPAPAGIPTPQPQTASTSAPPTGGSSGNAESLGDAARRAKQHARCLELAKDNPAISCK